MSRVTGSINLVVLGIDHANIFTIYGATMLTVPLAGMDPQRVRDITGRIISKLLTANRLEWQGQRNADDAVGLQEVQEKDADFLSRQVKVPIKIIKLSNRHQQGHYSSSCLSVVSGIIRPSSLRVSEYR